MKQFLLLYCPYDPDNYRGHRCETIPAENLDEAKKRAKDFLNQLCTTREMEFRLIEMAHDSGSRNWYPGAGDDDMDNAYQNRTYFNVTG